nr:MAG TPA: 60S ribosomal subunit [Bacteriophage sp.]
MAFPNNIFNIIYNCKFCHHSLTSFKFLDYIYIIFLVSCFVKTFFLVS